jgi:hypothetical protein
VVAAAAVGQDLQVVIKTNNDVLYHAIRFSADGAWNGLNDVSCCATVPSSTTAVSLAGT